MHRSNAYPRARGRARAALCGDRGRRGVRHVRARGRCHRAVQLLVDGSRLSRRPVADPGRRDTGERRGGPAHMQDTVARRDAASGVEPRRAEPLRFLWAVGGSPGRRRAGQRLQGAMGALFAPRRRRRAVRPRLLRRREGRAARGAGAQVVGRAALDRHSPSPEGRGGQGVRPITSRVAYAAAHVVCDPQSPTEIDWEATLGYRRYLWSLGLGVAEAMDTAQRGMGLDWPQARELIRRSLAEASASGGLIACGAGTDQLVPDPRVTLEDVERAYEEQVGYVEGQGGRVILMASRALARAARSADDYVRVYGTILRQVRRPVILHWLGDMFDPQLTAYWGSRDLGEAMEVCLRIIGDHREKVDGIKISLLDPAREVAMRARLPEGVRR